MSPPGQGHRINIGSEPGRSFEDDLTLVRDRHFRVLVLASVQGVTSLRQVSPHLGGICPSWITVPSRGSQNTMSLQNAFRGTRIHEDNDLIPDDSY